MVIVSVLDLLVCASCDSFCFVDVDMLTLTLIYVDVHYMTVIAVFVVAAVVVGTVAVGAARAAASARARRGPRARAKAASPVLRKESYRGVLARGAAARRHGVGALCLATA